MTHNQGPHVPHPLLSQQLPRWHSQAPGELCSWLFLLHFPFLPGCAGACSWAYGVEAWPWCSDQTVLPLGQTVFKVPSVWGSHTQGPPFTPSPECDPRPPLLPSFPPVPSSLLPSPLCQAPFLHPSPLPFFPSLVISCVNSNAKWKVIRRVRGRERNSARRAMCFRFESADLACQTPA